MKVALASQVRLIDKLSIEEYKLNSLTLMKNAATAAFETIVEKIENINSVCIFCGKGNNAGDGFALANMLVLKNISVSVMLLCGEPLSPDAQYYFDHLDPKVYVAQSLPEADVYVDAVFGTGFSGTLPKEIADLFETVNQKDCVRVAIDVPSGVNCDTGKMDDNSFGAHFTVTFELLKRCHILPECQSVCGSVFVKNIGLSQEAIENIDINTEILEERALPKKSSALHKGTNGTLFNITGCKQYQGAATLSINSALRCGCGIVTAFIPESIYIPVACKTDGAIIVSCIENSRHTLDCSVIETVAEYDKSRTPRAILVGSGLGIDEDTGKIVDFVLKSPYPCVIDGDGLRFVKKELLINRQNATILTPHMGEFARMCQYSIQQIKEDRFEIARKFALEHNVVLVLKDSITIISLPNGKQHVLNACNPGLAKGGSGDVLAGMIASFLAQGFSAEDAAKNGVWYHSKAGKIAAEQLGEYAMLPSDLIKFLPMALK